MYFEVEDIQRRHAPYYDVYNIHGWVDTPEDSFSWAWARGAFAGLVGGIVGANVTHFWDSYKTLRTVYHPPKNLMQVRDFYRARLHVPDYKMVSL